MKKFIIAALAASVLITLVLAADHRGNNNGRYEQLHRQVTKRVVVERNDRNGQNQYRSWHRGQRFESPYARNYRVGVSKSCENFATAVDA